VNPSHCNDVAWTSGVPLIVARNYDMNGDARSIQRHWSSLTRYTYNLVSKASFFPGNVTACDPGDSWFHGENVALGDWCMVGNCTGKPAGISRCNSSSVISGFSYVLTLSAMATMSGAIGDGSAGSVRWASESGIGIGILNLPAIVLDCAPTAAVKAQTAVTVEHDLANRDYHPSTGAVLSNWLLDTLSKSGLHLNALKIAKHTTYPSWRWWLDMNATTCWEVSPHVPCC